VSTSLLLAKGLMLKSGTAVDCHFDLRAEFDENNFGRA